jgi:hypothetical protein
MSGVRSQVGSTGRSPTLSLLYQHFTVEFLDFSEQFNDLFVQQVRAALFRVGSCVEFNANLWTLMVVFVCGVSDPAMCRDEWFRVLFVGVLVILSTCPDSWIFLR